MTLRKSFWDRLVKSNRNNIWMWVVSMLIMLAAFPIKMLVNFNSYDAPTSISKASEVAFYIRNMRECVCDALGFNGMIVFAILGIIIPVKIFAYLNDKSRMDMIRSLPVKHKDTYTVEYVSVVLMGIIPYLISLVLTAIIATGWGFMTGLALKECLLGILINVSTFLIAVNITIICICLTGNWGVAIAGSLAVQYLPGIAERTVNSMKYDFFKTANVVFEKSTCILSPYITWYYKKDSLIEANSFKAELSIIGVYLCAWIILAAITVYISYRVYMARPVEAMNKIVYSRKIQIAGKIIFGICATIICSNLIYESASYRRNVMAISVVICGLIIGMVFEAIYAGEFKAVIRSLWSSAVIVVTGLGIFLIFNYDLVGFDGYVPSEVNTQSYAIDVNPSGYSEVFQMNYESTEKRSETISWYSPTDYYRDHMYIRDVDAIRRLAEKCRDNKLYELVNTMGSSDIYAYSVYYRSKFGINRSRTVYVDMKDDESVNLINRIVASSQWREGFFQVLGDEESLSKCQDFAIRYTNGLMTYYCDCEYNDIINAFKKDMECFDYYFGSQNVPVGSISIKVSTQEEYYFTLPVYENFVNTLGIIRDNSLGYKDLKLTADDIDSIRVTNYHSEYWDQPNVDYSVDPTVSATITDDAEVEELIGMMNPQGIGRMFTTGDDPSYTYDVQVFFATDSVNVQGKNMMYFAFNQKAPEWLEERTQLKDTMVDTN